MIASFFFLFSILVLTLIFFKRFRQMVRDQELQKDLLEPLPEETALLSNESFQNTPDLEEDSFTKQEKASPTQLKALLGQAEKALNHGSLEDAKTFYLEILEADSLHPEALLAMGNLSIHFQDFAQAEFYLSKLVHLNKDANAFSMLGICLYHQNRLVEAAEAYENAISLDASKSTRHTSLGQIYTEIGEHEKALRAYEMALEKSPRDKELLYNLAIYYESLRRYERALELSHELIQLFGKESGFVDLELRCVEGIKTLKSEQDSV